MEVCKAVVQALAHRPWLHNAAFEWNRQRLVRSNRGMKFCKRASYYLPQTSAVIFKPNQNPASRFQRLTWLFLIHITAFHYLRPLKDLQSPFFFFSSSGSKWQNFGLSVTVAVMKHSVYVWAEHMTWKGKMACRTFFKDWKWNWGLLIFTSFALNLSCEKKNW